MNIWIEILAQGVPKEWEWHSKSLLLVLWFFLLTDLVLGQEARKDEILLLRQQTVEELMESNDAGNPLLKYGKEYRHRYPNTDGSQFFDGKVFDDCTIDYDGLSFNKVILQYDNYNGFVLTPVIPNTHTNFLILDNRKISKFTLGRRQFIYVGDSIEQGSKRGIYQLAFDGMRSRLLISRLKRLDSPLYREYGELDKFVSFAKYYLQTSSGVFRLASKKDLLQNLDSNSELKAFIKQNKLKLKIGKIESAPEILKVLRYYETLDFVESVKLPKLN